MTSQGGTVTRPEPYRCSEVLSGVRTHLAPTRNSSEEASPDAVCRARRPHATVSSNVPTTIRTLLRDLRLTRLRGANDKRADKRARPVKGAAMFGPGLVEARMSYARSRAGHRCARMTVYTCEQSWDLGGPWSCSIARIQVPASSKRFMNRGERLQNQCLIARSPARSTLMLRRPQATSIDLELVQACESSPKETSNHRH